VRKPSKGRLARACASGSTTARRSSRSNRAPAGRSPCRLAASHLHSQMIRASNRRQSGGLGHRQVGFIAQPGGAKPPETCPRVRIDYPCAVLLLAGSPPTISGSGSLQLSSATLGASCSNDVVCNYSTVTIELLAVELKNK
jgi:hypothetical protein